ncbi:MAG: aminoacyl-tRNA hydrolase [Acidobacteria bacterium]|nr:aminoacyl-tRNA hydrolase [Acidobacteriota bacterium]
MQGETVLDVQVSRGVSIPEDELRFTASRSSGPGGQNVNKVATRITLLFDLEDSPSLSRVQKERIQKRLATRISNQGVLRLVCQRHRRQVANKREVVERFGQLMADALRIRRPRKKTRVSRSVKKRRREEKEQRSRLKRLRSSAVDLDE